MKTQSQKTPIQLIGQNIVSQRQQQSKQNGLTFPRFYFGMSFKYELFQKIR